MDTYTTSRSFFISNAEVGALSYAGCVANFLKHRSSYDHVLRYDDLKADPEAEARRLFEALGFPLKYLPLAMDALKYDSQNEEFNAKARKIALSRMQERQIDEVFQRMGVPLSMDMSEDEFIQVLA